MNCYFGHSGLLLLHDHLNLDLNHPPFSCSSLTFSICLSYFFLSELSKLVISEMHHRLQQSPNFHSQVAIMVNHQKIQHFLIKDDP